MSNRGFSGKRVVLTGASSGIGWYIASELVRAGAYVAMTSRRNDRLQQLRRSFGNPRKRLIALPGDIADEDHRRRFIDFASQELGGIDILINNAGVGAFGEFETATSERLRRVFEVDFFAATELTRLSLPYLRKGLDPTICLVSSVLSHRAVPRKSEYCAAKFALRGWADALRLELKPTGIDVVQISPSTTRSEFFDSLLEGNEPKSKHKRYAQPAQSVAQSVLKAIRRGKREVILSPGGKAFVWLSRLFPPIADNLILQYAP